MPFVPRKVLDKLLRDDAAWELLLREQREAGYHEAWRLQQERINTMFAPPTYKLPTPTLGMEDLTPKPGAVSFQREETRITPA